MINIFTHTLRLFNIRATKKLQHKRKNYNTNKAKQELSLIYPARYIQSDKILLLLCSCQLLPPLHGEQFRTLCGFEGVNNVFGPASKPLYDGGPHYRPPEQVAQGQD